MGLAETAICDREAMGLAETAICEREAMGLAETATCATGTVSSGTATATATVTCVTATSATAICGIEIGAGTGGACGTAGMAETTGGHRKVSHSSDRPVAAHPVVAWHWTRRFGLDN